MALERPARLVERLDGPPQAHQRVLQQGQDQHRIVRIDHRPDHQRRQDAHRRIGQGSAGRGVRLHAPARQPGRDPPGQGLVGGDQRAGLAGNLQRLA